MNSNNGQLLASRQVSEDVTNRHSTVCTIVELDQILAKCQVKRSSQHDIREPRYRSRHSLEGFEQGPTDG